jgi:hypothetical protein
MNTLSRFAASFSALLVSFALGCTYTTTGSSPSAEASDAGASDGGSDAPTAVSTPSAAAPQPCSADGSDRVVGGTSYDVFYEQTLDWGAYAFTKDCHYCVNASATSYLLEGDPGATWRSSYVDGGRDVAIFTTAGSDDVIGYVRNGVFYDALGYRLDRSNEYTCDVGD